MVTILNAHELKHMIRSIPTEWGQGFYRSRNEARWAVGFDGVDLRVMHEPVGVILPSGLRYLADFYIKDSGYLIDAKEEGMADETIKNPNIQEAMEFFNDPNNKGIIIEGFPYPINGLLITPQKFYLNDADGEYAAKHEWNKEREKTLYAFFVKIIGLSEDDPRFTEWGTQNPNFNHIKRTVRRMIHATFEHGGASVKIGYRDAASKQTLMEEYGTDKLNEHTEEYLWSYMAKHQLRHL